MNHAVIGRAHLVLGPGVAGQRHRRVAGAMVGAIPGDDRAAWLLRRLARELDRVFVRVAAAEREEDPPSLEARFLQQEVGEFRSRLGAP